MVKIKQQNKWGANSSIKSEIEMTESKGTEIVFSSDIERPKQQELILKIPSKKKTWHNKIWTISVHVIRITKMNPWSEIIQIRNQQKLNHQLLLKL